MGSDFAAANKRKRQVVMRKGTSTLTASFHGPISRQTYLFSWVPLRSVHFLETLNEDVQETFFL